LYISLPAPENEREREKNSRERENESPWEICCETSLGNIGNVTRNLRSLRVWPGILQNFPHSQEKSYAHMLKTLVGMTFQ